MTSFEHAMIGINGALAAGLHRQHGWKIVAFAGVAAISPDWDGLTILAGMETFDTAHRVWGHNFLVVMLVSVCLAIVDFRFDVTTRVARFGMRLCRRDNEALLLRKVEDRRPIEWGVWLVVGCLAALSHLPADLVYSGGYGLSDWELKLLWPFSQAGFVYPMIRWGDPGVTVIFAVMMIAMAKRPATIERLARVALLLMVAYVTVRGVTR